MQKTDLNRLRAVRASFFHFRPIGVMAAYQSYHIWYSMRGVSSATNSINM